MGAGKTRRISLLVSGPTQPRYQSAILEQTHVFSPTVFNTARIGFLRANTVAGLTTTQIPETANPDFVFVPGRNVMGALQVSGLTDHPGGAGSEDIDRHIFNSFSTATT